MAEVNQKTKRAEFHEAKIEFVVKIVDEDRSYGTQRFNVTVLVDSGVEWDAAVQMVHDKISELTEAVENAND